MNIFKDKKKRKIFLSITIPLLILVLVSAFYLGDFYRADSKAVSAFAVSQNVTSEIVDGNIRVYKTENAETGLIFYPGGKVEYTSYEPLMMACAEKGIMCVLLEMPFNLAVFDVNAAEGIQAKFPQIKNWYVGGHSLGGSMAASYLEGNKEKFEGLVLLASYSTSDFSETDLKVLSVYGSEDKVLNMEKYEENKTNLPDDFEEYVIDGGCHAYFGMYGSQDGDGKPTVSNTEQIKITAEKIADFCRVK